MTVSGPQSSQPERWIPSHDVVTTHTMRNMLRENLEAAGFIKNDVRIVRICIKIL